jgi:serine O-acetyltransferase
LDVKEMIYMRLNTWLNNDMPDVVRSLEETNKKHFLEEKTIGFAGKEKVYSILYNLRSALFPGVYEKFPIDETRINIIIGNNIRTAALELSNLIEKALENIRKSKETEPKDCTKCRDRANDITIDIIKRLPEIREKLHTDIQAAFNGDPAARTTEEILLGYPSINAVSIYRIAHVLYEHNVPIIPRIMSEYAHQQTGIDIHQGAKIGVYFFIDHGTGVVIGETAIVGNNVTLYHGVTLGGTGKEKGKRHPTVEDNVMIGAGAKILGPVVIGRCSKIGANAVVLKDIPPYSTAVGVPAEVVKNTNECAFEVCK